MRSECLERHIVTFAIETHAQEATTCSSYIRKAVKDSFKGNLSELEYVVREGQFMSGRLAEEPSFNNAMRDLISPSLGEELVACNKALSKFTVGTPGVLDTLQLVKDTQCALGEFGLGDIEIEANVCGLDFRDILVGFGRIRVDDLGIDYGVIITRGWPACKSDIRPGGSACVVSLGSMWTIVRSHRTSLRKVS